MHTAQFNEEPIMRNNVITMNSNQPLQAEDAQMAKDTVNIGLSKKTRDGVIELLNIILAHEYVLYTKTLNYHWNVYGMQFHDLHAFFKDQYEKLFEYADDVAERVATLGGRPVSTLKEFLSISTIKEVTSVPTAYDMMQDLLEGHELIIRLLRQGIADTQEKLADAGTNNFLTDLMEKHEKVAWMLRSSVKKAK